MKTHLMLIVRRMATVLVAAALWIAASPMGQAADDFTVRAYVQDFNGTYGTVVAEVTSLSGDVASVGCDPGGWAGGYQAGIFQETSGGVGTKFHAGPAWNYYKAYGSIGLVLTGRNGSGTVIVGPRTVYIPVIPTADYPRLMSGSTKTVDVSANFVGTELFTLTSAGWSWGFADSQAVYSNLSIVAGHRVVLSTTFGAGTASYTIRTSPIHQHNGAWFKDASGDPLVVSATLNVSVVGTTDLVVNQGTMCSPNLAGDSVAMCTLSTAYDNVGLSGPDASQFLIVDPGGDKPQSKVLALANVLPPGSYSVTLTAKRSGFPDSSNPVSITVTVPDVVGGWDPLAASLYSPDGAPYISGIAKATNGDIYIIGHFTKVDGVTAYYAARRVSGVWEAIPGLSLVGPPVYLFAPVASTGLDIVSDGFSIVAGNLAAPVSGFSAWAVESQGRVSTSNALMNQFLVNSTTWTAGNGGAAMMTTTGLVRPDGNSFFGLSTGLVPDRSCAYDTNADWTWSVGNIDPVDGTAYTNAYNNKGYIRKNVFGQISVDYLPVESTQVNGYLGLKAKVGGGYYIFGGNVGIGGRLIRGIGYSDPSGLLVTECGTGVSGSTTVNAPPKVRTTFVDANGNVYIGGTFTSVGGVAAPQMAVWDPPPTDITISTTVFPETDVTGTNLATVAATDVNSTGFTYQLLTGTGGEDNSYFQLAGSTLQAAAAINYDNKSSYKILVKASEVSNPAKYITKAFTLLATSIPKPPTSVTLTSTSFQEGNPAGLSIGTLGYTDNRDATAHSYQLVVGAVDNAKFAIVGGVLKTAKVFSLTGGDTAVQTVRIRCTNTYGLYIDQNINLTVTVNPNKPSLSTIANQFMQEASTGSAIPFTISHPTVNVDTLTYTVVSDNHVVLPDANCVLAGSGTNRTITLSTLALPSDHPAFAWVTITASDGLLADSTTFLVTVSSGKPMVMMTGIYTIYRQPGGATWVTGGNLNGQFGDGTTNSTKVFKRAPQLDEAITFAGSGASLLYLTSDGTLKGVGNNINGQIGRGQPSVEKTPRIVAYEVADIAMGPVGSIIRKTDGTAYAAGRASSRTGYTGGYPNFSTRWTDGYSDRDYTQYADANTGGNQAEAGVPREYHYTYSAYISSNNDNYPYDGPQGYPMDGVGGYTGYTSGAYQYGFHGALGFPPSTVRSDSWLPIRTNVNRLAVGMGWSVVTQGSASFAQGAVHLYYPLTMPNPPADTSTWFNNYGYTPFLYPIIGFGTAGVYQHASWYPYAMSGTSTPAGGNYGSPYRIADIPSDSTLVAGYYTLYAVSSSGQMSVRGANNKGQMGLGDTLRREVMTDVPSMNNVAQVAAGMSHAIARKTDGSIWVCGLNHHGQLGIGDQVNRTSWTRVGSFVNCTYVAAGESQSSFVDSNGDIWVAGHNDVGQLGLGDTAPAEVTIFTKIAITPPTNILISATTVPERQANALVGTLTGVDTKSNPTHYFTLVSGTGSGDNGSFVIVGNSLFVNATPLDLNNRMIVVGSPIMNVRVRCTDQYGVYVERSFALTLTNANEPPTAVTLALTSGAVPDTATAGYEVGTLATVDPDLVWGDTASFALVAGSGSDHNSYFKIVGNKLQVDHGGLLYQNFNTASIRVRGTDGGSLYFEQAMTFPIADMPKPPSLISLSPSSVLDNVPVGTVVGQITCTDANGDYADYVINSVTGSNSTSYPNAFVMTVGPTSYALKTNMALNYQTCSSYTLNITATDRSSAHLTRTQDVVVTVVDVNKPPTSITLTPSIIPENQSLTADVQLLSATDPENYPVGQFVYSFTGTGNDNGSFLIQPYMDQDAAGLAFRHYVRPNITLNEVVKNTYTLRIRATKYNKTGGPYPNWSWSSTGLYYDQDVVVTIGHINRPPTDIACAGTSIAKMAPAGTTVGLLSYVGRDQDSGAVYTIDPSGTGSAYFTVAADGKTLVTALPIPANAPSTLTPRVKVTAFGTLTYTKDIALSVINQVPTNISLTKSGQPVTTIPEGQALPYTVGTLTAVDADAGDTAAFALVDASNAVGPTATYRVSGRDYVLQIVGGDLQVLTFLNSRQVANLPIKVQVTDGSGATYQKPMPLPVVYAPVPTTDVQLSSNTIPESASPGTTVGTLSGVNIDPACTYTFTLGAGGDNAAFDIVGSLLVTKTTFNYPVKSSYAIAVTCLDMNGNTIVRNFTIGITHVNHAPIGIALSATGFPETTARDSVIATITGTDPDTAVAGDTLTYSLASGGGSGDNSKFYLVGNQIYTGVSFDWLNTKTCAIRLRATDNGGLVYDQTFVLTVGHVNLPPTDLALSSYQVPEAAPIGSNVGTFTDVDRDPADTASFSLYTAPATVNDNAMFTITQASPTARAYLNTAVALDYNVKSQALVVVRVTDSAGNTLDKPITIQIRPTDHPATSITLDRLTVAEHAAVGTFVGGLTAVEPDLWDSPTFSLPPGLGDNADFRVDSGTRVVTNNVFNYWTKSTYNIVVRATGGGGATYDQAFTIAVTNIDDAPTDINISIDSVNEGLPVDTIVGVVTGVNPDHPTGMTFSLVGGAGSTDNNLFTIVNTAGTWTLRTASVLSYLQANTRTVRLRATDTVGLTYEKALIIAVRHVNHAPTDWAISRSSIDDGVAIGSSVGSLSTSDVDAPVGDSWSYSLIPGSGSDDNALFRISGQSLVSAAVFNYWQKSSYTVRIRTTDSGGLTFEKPLTVTVTKVNKVPYDLALSNTNLMGGSPTGTVVGTLQAYSEDPDITTYTYRLVQGRANNSLFTLVDGNKVATNAVIAYSPTGGAQANQYAIDVIATDGYGLSIEKALAIIVADPNANVAPTDIVLSATTVAEGLPVNSTVATIAGTDINTDETLTYQLVSGSGDNDNGSFTVVGSDLRNASIFNAAVKSVYRVRLKVTDHGGLYFAKPFLITVTPVTYGTRCTQTAVAENHPVGTVVGIVSIIDLLTPASGHTLAFDPIGPDNSNFNLAANQDGTWNLVTAAVFNRLSKASHAIAIKVTNDALTSVTTNYVITVSSYDPPVVEVYTGTTAEGSALSANLAVHTTDGAEPTASTRYSITQAPTKGTVVFTTGTAFTYTPSPYQNGTDTFTVVARDGAMISAPALATITITPVNDAPVLDTTDTFKIPAVPGDTTDPAGITIPALIATSVANAGVPITDPDAGAVLGLAVVGQNTGNGGVFQFSIDSGTTWAPIGTVMPSNTLLLASNAQTKLRFLPNRYWSGTASVTVRAWDQTQGSNGQTINITATGTGGSTAFSTSSVVASVIVTPVNHAPTAGTLDVATLEDTAKSGTVPAADVDAGDVLTIRVQGEPSLGTVVITNATTGAFVYTPRAFTFGTDTWTYSVSDGQSTATGTVTVTITHTNHAPVLDTSDGMRLAAVARGDTTNPGSSIQAIIASSSANASRAITDVDQADVIGLAVVGSDTANGTWQWSVDDGATWNAMGTVMPTNALLLAADGTSRVRFQPRGTYVGSATISMRAWDGTAGSAGTFINQSQRGAGGNTAFSSATLSPTISVVDPLRVNLAPTDVVLSQTAVTSHLAPGTTLATVSAIDPNPGDSATFDLVAGYGDGDNSKVTIYGTSLVSQVSTAVGVWSLRLRATDRAGASFEKTVTITITPATLALDLSSNKLDEHMGPTTIGTFAVVDTAGTGPYTVTLINGPGLRLGGTGNLDLLSTRAFDVVTEPFIPCTVRLVASGARTLTTTFYVAVQNVVDAPVPQAQSIVMDQGGTVVIVPTGTAESGNALRFSLGSQPASGTAVVNTAGTSITYTPTSSFIGTDVFEIQAFDGIQTSTVSAPITVEVRPVQHAPVLDGSVPMALQTISGRTRVNTGTAVVDIIASSTANGGDAIVDADAGAREGLAIVAAPAASLGQWQYTVSAGTSGWITFPALSATAALQLAADSARQTRIRFLPTDSTSTGMATLTARAWDMTAGSNGITADVASAGTGGKTAYSVGTVTVAIAVASNLAPTVTSSTFSVTKGSSTQVSLVAHDPEGDPIVFRLSTAPVNGTVSWTNTATGTLTYRPTAGFAGTDSFAVIASDGSADSVTTTIGVTVVDVPEAQNDTVYLVAGTTRVLALRAISSGGRPLTFAVAQSPALASVSLDAASGRVTLTPNGGVTTGSDLMTWTASDGTNSSLVATLRITYLATAVPPVTSALGVTTPLVAYPGVPLSGSLAAYSPTGVPLTYAIQTQPAHGTLTLDPNTGLYTYTPVNPLPPGVTSDTFTYTVTDPVTGQSYPVTVTLSLRSPPPVVYLPDVGATTVEDVALNLPLVAQTTATGAITYAMGTQPRNGTVSLGATSGICTYTPNLHWNGVDSFTVVPSVGSTAGPAGTVTITVASINQAPTLDGTSGLTMPVVVKGATQSSGILVRDLIATSTVAQGHPITDPDAGALQGVAIVGQTVASGCTFQFSTNNGSTWTAIGAVAETSGRLLAADSATRVRLVPSATFLGTAALTLRAWDQTNGTNGTLVNVFAAGMGGRTAFSADTVSATCEVRDGATISTAPILTSNGGSLGTVSSRAVTNRGATITEAIAALGANAITTTTGRTGLVITSAAAGGLGTWQISSTGGSSWTDLPTVSERAALQVAVTESDSVRLRFVPVSGAQGTTSLTVRAWDQSTGTSGTTADLVTTGTGGTSAYSTASTTLTLVVAANSTPVVAAATVRTTQNQPVLVSIGVTDADGDTTVCSTSTAPQHGYLTWVSAADGTCRYTPAPNWSGTDSFAVVANDSRQIGSPGIVTVEVAAINQPPSAQDSSILAVGGTRQTFRLLATDPEGNAITYALTNTIAHGVVVLDAATGVCTIQVDADAISGSERLAFTASDGLRTSSEAAVTLTYAATRLPPIASDVGVVTPIRAVMGWPVSGILTAIAPSGDPLTYSLTVSPSQGTLILDAATGAFTYTPRTGLPAGGVTDAFTYTVSDGQGGVTTVNPTIAIDTATYLVFIADSATTTGMMIPVGGAVVAQTALSGAIVYQVVTQPTHGTVTINEATGAYTYAPATNWSGMDGFEVRASIPAASAVSNIAQVAVKTIWSNQPPSFAAVTQVRASQNDGLVTVRGAATAISPGAPSESAQRLAFTVQASNAPLFAVMPAMDSQGTLTFTLARNAYGTATLTVILTDDGGTVNGGQPSSAPATIALTVARVNQPPTFRIPTTTVAATQGGGAITRAGFVTDIDPGAPSEAGQLVTFRVTTANAGLFTTAPAIDNAGTLTFTPKTGVHGQTTITVVAVDDATMGGPWKTSAPQTATIDIVAANQVPTFTGGGDVTVAGDSGAYSKAWATNVSAGAGDAGQTVQFTCATVSTNGLAFAASPAIDAQGTLTFTPAAMSAGTATVTVTATDDDPTAPLTTSPTTFTITVTAVNHAPLVTVAPQMRGVGLVGQTLTCTTGTWQDPDGASVAVTTSIQWYTATSAAGDGAQAIAGATTASVTVPTDASYVMVRISGRDPQGATTVAQGLALISQSRTPINALPIAASALPITSITVTGSATGVGSVNASGSTVGVNGTTWSYTTTRVVDEGVTAIDVSVPAKNVHIEIRATTIPGGKG